MPLKTAILSFVVTVYYTNFIYRECLYHRVTVMAKSGLGLGSVGLGLGAS